MSSQVPLNQERFGRYTNHLEIGHNSFEFVLDFGQAFHDSSPLMHTRLISGPVYVKAMLATLREAVERYESEYGVIPETPPAGGTGGE